MNNPDFKVAPLFSTPIYQSSFKITQEDKNKLFDADYKRMQADNGYVTENMHILDLPEFQHIRNGIVKRLHDYMDFIIGIDRFVEDPPLEFYMTNSWGVKHLPGDWGHKHSHQNALFSGIIYLNVDDNSGDITFYDKESADRLFPHIFFIPMKEVNMLSAKDMRFKPVNDDIYFFPAHVDHSIGKHESTITRYSLAFNFWMKGKLGQFAGELTL